MRTVRILPCLLFLLVSAAVLQADQRTENIDILVAVDKSLSMVDEIDAVKEYFDAYVVDQVAIPGDFLVVMAFYGRTEVLYSGELRTDNDRSEVKRRIAEIRANGRYTDIGTALDVVKEQFDARASNGRKKFVLLITDGIQEAPPESRYASKDGRFNHAFLSSTKTIQKEGWKVQVLGIGTVTAGAELSRELSATFQEIPKGTTPEAIRGGTTDLFGTIEAVGGPKLTGPDSRGAGAVSLELKSRGFPAAVKVQVSGIRIEDPVRAVGDVLTAPWTLEVPAEGSSKVRIPVTFPRDLPAGTEPCRIFFTFAPGERFTPSEFDAVLSVPSWLQHHLPAVALGVAAALLLVGGVVLLILRKAANRPVSFTVTRDGKDVSGCPIRIVPGQSAYLIEEGQGLRVDRKSSPDALASFSARSGKLALRPIRRERFAGAGTVPPDVLEWGFVLQSGSGKAAKVEIHRVERA